MKKKDFLTMILGLSPSELSVKKIELYKEYQLLRLQTEKTKKGVVNAVRKNIARINTIQQKNGVKT